MVQGTITQPQVSTRSALWLTIICWLLPAIALLALGKSIPALAVLAIPAVLIVTFPEGCLYLLILSLASYYGLLTVGSLVPMACDFAFALLLAAVVLDYLLHVRATVCFTPLDIPFALLIGATFVSAAFAHDPAMSVVPSVRIVVVYLAFRSIFVVVRQTGVRRVLLFYIGFVVVLSVVNCVWFALTAGKQRVFGPAWLAFEILSLTALPMSLAFGIWARSKAEQFRFLMAALLILFAIFATQSRAPLLTVVIAVPALLLFARRKLQREGTRLPGLRIQTMVAITVIVGLLAFIPVAAYFFGFFGRVGEFVASAERPQGTVALRLVLWKAAWLGFLTNPLTGIGIGNYRIIDQIIPELRAEPVWYYIRGMSAHNVVLHYLAETGILGLGALLALTFRGYTLAREFFRRSLTVADSQVSAALFITMFIFAITIFYTRAWTWGQEGYLMALFFALTAAWSIESRERGAHAE